MVAVVRWYLSAFHAGRKVVIVFCLFVWFFSETAGGGLLDRLFVCNL